MQRERRTFRGLRGVWLAFGLMALLACSLIQPATPGDGESAAEGETPQAAPESSGGGPIAEHRIGVREGADGPEFYDRQTGETFVPRGANLWQWAFWDTGDDPALIDTMFNTEIGQLDPALEALRQMGAEGYNVVRVWSNACWGGAPGCMDRPGGGMDPAYLENLSTFLQVARDNGITVMLTLDDVPGNGTYRRAMDAECCDPFHGFNLEFASESGVEANRRYLVDTIEGLRDVGAPMDAIWAYELRNEGFFEAQLPPLSWESGTVTAANGVTYDMGDDAQRRAFVEENWLNYIDVMVTAIKEVEPTALVTMGFFVQNEPIPIHPGDPRTVYLGRVLNESALDFVDLHGYPGFDLSMEEHARNFDIIDYNEKPLVLGEFGAHRFNFPDVADAAAALQAWQVASCAFGFDGWMAWTWTGGEVQDEFWTAVEGDFAIARALSPNRNPDPCQPGPEITGHRNLALYRSVTASSAPEVAAQPHNAFDLSMGSWWSAGGGPPAWIEVDLGAPTTIAGVRLPIGHVAPEGFQIHRVTVRGPATGDAYQLLHEFAGEVHHGDVLEYVLPAPMEGVQYVRLETLAADGWVIWHEIEVLRAP